MSLCSPPLIETYREGAVCPSYACLYSSVLSLLQKPVNVRVRSRTVSGNEFQIEGPEVAKLRDPCIHCHSIHQMQLCYFFMQYNKNYRRTVSLTSSSIQWLTNGVHLTLSVLIFQHVQHILGFFSSFANSHFIITIAIKTGK